MHTPADLRQRAQLERRRARLSRRLHLYQMLMLALRQRVQAREAGGKDASTTRKTIAEVEQAYSRIHQALDAIARELDEAGRE